MLASLATLCCVAFGSVTSSKVEGGLRNASIPRSASKASRSHATDALAGLPPELPNRRSYPSCEAGIISQLKEYAVLTTHGCARIRCRRVRLPRRRDVAQKEPGVVGLFQLQT